MTTRPAEHIFRTAELRDSGYTSDDIRREVRRGAFVRLRRGSLCLASTWNSLDDRQRHVLRAAAVAADVREPVLAGRSAAAVWGIPVLGGSWPEEVTLLTTFRGGGKSEPGVRRTAAGAAAAPITLAAGLPVTTAARTVVDLAAVDGFVAGVMAADWALRSGISRDELWESAETRRNSRGIRTVMAVLEFAQPGAENGGESAARAAMHRLGFVVPELQVVFVDEEGEMRTDFWWKGVRKAGEFDGKRKYTRHEYTDGDPGEVVWREKKREDRLRRLTEGVLRILWTHVTRPAEMDRLLREAGIPRRRSAATDPLLAGSAAPRIHPWPRTKLDG